MEQTKHQRNYYLVTCKCGHVGKNNCIFIDFPVVAESKKAAAGRARYFGRVKHDDKYAIRCVVEINQDEFSDRINEIQDDPYFVSKSIQEQRASSFDWSLVQRDEEKLSCTRFRRKGRISSEKMRSQRWREQESSDDSYDIYD